MLMGRTEKESKTEENKMQIQGDNSPSRSLLQELTETQPVTRSRGWLAMRRVKVEGICLQAPS